MEKLKINYFNDNDEPESVAVSSSTTAIIDQPGDAQPNLDQPADGQHFVRLDNANSQDNSIYDKLSGPRYNPEAAKIAEEARIGTLDDNVDITDPDYDEAETQVIEDELASGHYHP